MKEHQHRDQNQPCRGGFGDEDVMIDLSGLFTLRAAQGLYDQVAVNVPIVKIHVSPGRQYAAFDADGMDVQSGCVEEIEQHLSGQGAILAECERRIVVWPVVGYTEPLLIYLAIETKSCHFSQYSIDIDQHGGLKRDIQIKRIGTFELVRVEVENVEPGITSFQKQPPAGIITYRVDRSV